MRKKILFLAGMMACCTWAGAQEISKTWVADKGNGTYQNPVLHADYSDPDVCAVGDDFYMTASSSRHSYPSLRRFGELVVGELCVTGAGTERIFR